MRKFKGYMTLEASLIVPMVICVFCLIIYFSFYLYGRCMLSQDTYILAFRAVTTNLPEYEDDPVSYVMSKANEKAGNKYFGSSFPAFEADAGGDEIMVRARADAHHAAMGRYFLKPIQGWEYEAAGRASRTEYAEKIREITRAKDIATEVWDHIRGDD
ncbi:MAG: hypothetical protein K6E91_13770 [Butyrivibrio sp.]|nr:hypothetical protein [Butyrivibrio sp.]